MYAKTHSMESEDLDFNSVSIKCLRTWSSHCGNSMEFPQKSKMELPFDLAIPLLGLYLKNPETPIQRTYAPQCS